METKVPQKNWCQQAPVANRPGILTIYTPDGIPHDFTTYNVYRYEILRLYDRGTNTYFNPPQVVVSLTDVDAGPSPALTTGVYLIRIVDPYSCQIIVTERICNDCDELITDNNMPQASCGCCGN